MADAVLIDPQAAVEGQVELPPHFLGRRDIQPLAVLQQAERLIQPLLRQGEVGAGQLQQTFGVALLDGDSFLALLEVGHGQGFGQVGVDQLLLLGLQLLQPPPLADEQPPVFLLQLLQLRLDVGAHQLDQPVIELDAAPVADHPALDRLDGQERQLTVGALLVAAQAVVVRVDAAGLALGVADGQPRVAVGAEQRALQVVIMTPGAVAGQPPAAQHVLRLLPGLAVDKRRMLAVVVDAAVGDHADVVGAGQDAVHLAAGQRHRRPGGRGPGAHAAPGQLRGQFGDRPLAGGVGLKGPGDVRGAFRVKLDRLDLAAVNPGAAVEVAERRVARRAAAAGFLVQAFLGLVRQVLRVELGDGRHDAVQQGAGRRAVDRLSGRHQHRAGLVDGQPDGDIVGPVPGQAVDFVDDDVVDVALLHQAVQQRLQGRSIGGAGRGAGVDVLLDHLGAEVGRLASAGRALGRDGVALGLAAGAGLPRGADAQVQRRPAADHRNAGHAAILSVSCAGRARW